MGGIWIIRLLLYVLIGNQRQTVAEEFEYYPRKNGILLMDKHNFVAALYKFQFVLVYNYGNNRQSKDCEAEILKLQQKLKEKESVVHLGKINIEKEPDIDRKYPVSRTPLLRLFKNGKAFDYLGKLSTEHVLVWLDLAMNVPLEINLVSELNSLKQAAPVILGCFPGKSPAPAFKNFFNVSEHFVYDPLMVLPRFAVITSARVARDIGIHAGTIIVYKKFEDDTASTYTGDPANFEKLSNFFDDESRPVVYKHHIPEYGNKIVEETKTYQHLLFMSSDDKNYLETFKSFKAAALKFKKQPKNQEVVFIHVDLKYGNNAEHLNFFHIDAKKDVPCNRITKMDKYHSRYIPSRQDFSANGFTQFTEDCIRGRVQRSIRSESPPSDWDAYDVKVLVGKTYDNFVKDSKRTVFVMYYVPEDKKSSEVIPIFNQLAKDMKSNSSIVFGSMNVAKNDGEIDVHASYPSFKMFTTNGKVQRYNGLFQVSNIKSFIVAGGSPQEEEFHGMEFDFKWHDDTHPMPTVEEEEERVRKWEEEEKEILKKAVQHIVGKEPHTDPDIQERHPLQHLPLEERDPEHMDPKKHADLENLEEHARAYQYEHAEEF